MAFAEIGSLRSILPLSVNILALTATASKSIFDVVVKRLSMINPAVVGVSPNRSNIHLHVVPHLNLPQLSDKIADEVKCDAERTLKTILFCQTFTCCYQLYDMLRRKLKEHFTHPSGYPDMPQFRLIDMYHGGCMLYMRESILQEFTSVQSNIRIVLATSSFGMGIDCPDVRRIIHWGTPDSIEQYVQEIGRAGRDGMKSEAILMHRRCHEVSPEMLAYAQNTCTCRRTLLFSSFLFYELADNVNENESCCDICNK